MSRLLKPHEAAELVYVSRETISYWVRTGRLTRHPRPLSQRSKEIYKRDCSVRWYLISKKEVLKVSGTKQQRRRSKPKKRQRNTD